MKSRFWFILLAGLATLPLVAAAAVADRAAEEPLRQQELQQQNLQDATQRLSGQLAGIAAEFERNGLAGEDLRTIQSIQAVLARLSDQDMRQVLALLEQGRHPDTTVRQQGLTGAFAGQKTILSRLRQLLLEFERRQALEELSRRFRELAERQGQNLRAGAWLARAADRNRFSEEQKLSLQVQQLDQVHLKEETTALLARLDKVAADAAGTPAGERPQSVARQARAGGLLPALAAAAEDLKLPQQLPSATAHEKRAREQLREIARRLLMAKDAGEPLRAALRETEAAIAQQKQVMEETEKVEHREDLTAVQDHQFAVADQAELIQHDVATAAPAAAGHLRTALDRMQEARQLLRDDRDPARQRHQTPARQREALTALEQARRALQDQMAQATPEVAAPQPSLAHLQELQKQVQELARREESLRDQSAPPAKKSPDLRAQAPSQGELRDQAQAAQQKATQTAPAAVPALNAAMSQMEQAQKALAQNRNPREAQQAAIESLQRAGAQIGQEAARLEEAQKQLAGLEQLSNNVGGLMSSSNRLTPPPPARPPRAKPPASPRPGNWPVRKPPWPTPPPRPRNRPRRPPPPPPRIWPRPSPGWIRPGTSSTGPRLQPRKRRSRRPWPSCPPPKASSLIRWRT